MVRKSYSNNRKLAQRILSVFVLFAISTSSFAGIVNLSDTDDDATLMLSISDQVSSTDTNWASVTIQVQDDDVALTSGDSITVQLFDSDGVLFDDLLFTSQFNVTPAEVTAGLVNRTFDASFDPAPFLPDVGATPNTLEIFATAMVEKDACGVLCSNDQPKTSTASVLFTDAPPPPPEVPLIVSASDTVDDATLTLTVLDLVEIGTSDWAALHILVDDDEVALIAGDTITIELFDDDGVVGDDQIFSIILTVTAEEAAAGLVDRILDATFDPALYLLAEGDDTLELYAKALVNKAECGVLSCSFDDPMTQPISVRFYEPTDSSIPVPSTYLLLIASAAWWFGAFRSRVQ